MCVCVCVSCSHASLSLASPQPSPVDFNGGTPLKRGNVRTARNGTAIGSLGRFGAVQMKLKRFLLRYFPPGIFGFRQTQRGTACFV